MNWLKRQFTKQNLVLLLLIGLGAHNYYLQTKVEETSRYAKKAMGYANDAINYASDAADYARDAASEASDASSYAYDAYKNSFGQQCWSCP